MIPIGYCTQGGDDFQFVVAITYLENCMTVLYFFYFSGNLKNMVSVESNFIY